MELPVRHSTMEYDHNLEENPNFLILTGALKNRKIHQDMEPFSLCVSFLKCQEDILNFVLVGPFFSKDSPRPHVHQACPVPRHSN